MLSGFLPSDFTIEGIADWMFLAIGLTIGTSVSALIFQPLENAVSRGNNGGA
jgi:hypothetical protein